MMSSENSDLYEVTCLDCNTTKSYFTAQGVGYFKLNHEGHKLRVREPQAGADEHQAEQAAAVEVPRSVEEAQKEAAEPEGFEAESDAQEPAGPAETSLGAPVSQVMAEERVRLGSLVVDAVDEENGRAVKVYGIAGGQERFSVAFKMSGLAELNEFLESGSHVDGATHTTYVWTPDKVDLSMDVARMIEGDPVTEPTAEVAPAAEAESEPVPEQKTEVALGPEPQEAASSEIEPSSSHSDEVLLGKLSYVQPGEGYRLESVRISRVLRKFRWNTEPPYVVGAMFDNLMSVQSQTGMIKASVIEAVAALGYTFVAIEAPAGAVTAWFRKNTDAEADPDDDAPEMSAAPSA